MKPKDGDRYEENPDFVWVETLKRWVYRPRAKPA